jgi:hypothetical protein
MCSINNNASVLGCNDRFDNGGEVIDVWEGFHTEQHVIECAVLGIRCIFGCSDNYSDTSVGVIDVIWIFGVAPCRGLNRSFPKDVDL